ncbi:MAG TPA: site-specific DNA-methyltransferase [Bacteroidales bacterium]|nr:site-specific DNA-methyltransferase [Bacteroidales bacterium]HPS17286.1 site-specific DNA-methyltransferase [Bacteroidales bacterium]
MIVNKLKTDLTEVLNRALKREPNFVTDDGELKKWVVINKAQNYDAEVIELLLEEKELKEKFFINVKGILVFNQNLFVQFLEQKKYLNDSYTKYKNKVGVTINGKYLKQYNEVSLVWPFKDCVLEGGQSREEDKREEIFFNEILAQDEITQLLEPKVLTNAKRYTVKGEKSLDKFNRNEKGIITDNLIIKGNNLLCLHSIKNQFAGKIKFIYIDPPYNTGGAANTFKYNNTFNHSTWLTFMQNRISVARQLLDDNGAICIAIDDEEYAHLKVLCDDVLGRENYIGTIIVQSNPRGRTINSHFATCHEYALFYAKKISDVVVNNQTLTDEQEGDFDKSDDDGKFRFLPFRRSGGTSTPAERPNSEFTLYYSKKAKNIIAVGGEILDDSSSEYQPKEILQLDKDGELIGIEPYDFLKKNISDIIEVLPVDVLGKRRVWRWSDRKAILNAAKNGDFNVVISGDKYTVQLKDRIKEGRKPKTIWSDSKYDASANGTMLLKKLFNGDKLFSYPKSIYTVKDAVEIFTNSQANDIILDFFGGSGTTAHAVLELNKEDDGNRQFIITEQLDYIETVTSKRIQRIIEQNSNGDFVYLELKKYNQSFIEQIETAKDTKALLKIWEEMKAKSFLNYNVDIKKQEEHIEEFKALSVSEQKQHLIEILDKNQLYVNLSSLNDKDFAMSKEEMKVTRDFYQL